MALPSRPRTVLPNARASLTAAREAISDSGLVFGTFGNLSVVDRAAGVLAIKPSGVPYAELTPDKIVVVSLLASIVVLAIGIAARPQLPTSTQQATVYKPPKAILATSDTAPAVR